MPDTCWFWLLLKKSSYFLQTTLISYISKYILSEGSEKKNVKEIWFGYLKFGLSKESTYSTNNLIWSQDIADVNKWLYNSLNGM